MATLVCSAGARNTLGPKCTVETEPSFTHIFSPVRMLLLEQVLLLLPPCVYYHEKVPWHAPDINLLLPIPSDVILFLIHCHGWPVLPGFTLPHHPLPAGGGQDVGQGAPGHWADDPGTGWVEGVDQGQAGGEDVLLLKILSPSYSIVNTLNPSIICLSCSSRLTSNTPISMSNPEKHLSGLVMKLLLCHLHSILF